VGHVGRIAQCKLVYGYSVGGRVGCVYIDDVASRGVNGCACTELDVDYTKVA